MNTVALGEDVALHPRMPAAGLVAKVGAGFQQFLDVDTIGQAHPPYNF